MSKKNRRQILLRIEDSQNGKLHITRDKISLEISVNPEYRDYRDSMNRGYYLEGSDDFATAFFPITQQYVKEEFEKMGLVWTME